jgi:hypothetical protein
VLELEETRSTSEGIPLARLLANRERAVKKAAMTADGAVGGGGGVVASGDEVGMRALFSAVEDVGGAVGPAPAPKWDSELELVDGPVPMFI